MAEPSGQAAPVSNPWLVAISVMLATFMEVLDTAIASVALPYIAGSLSASTSEATWVLTSYLVANAVILPASNWFSLRFGRKRFLITCVILFTIASFFCGAAPTLPLLLVARVLQGAGGGALQPISQAVLLESFPPAKRGAAMAFFAFGIVVAPVLGPTLGGWLTDTYSWRYAFYINIPIGILAVYMINRFVHDPSYIKHAKVHPFDNLSFGLLLVWAGCLQVVLDKGQEDDWFGAIWVRWAVFAMVVCLIWFIVRSWRNRNGLVNLQILKNRNFAVGCLLISLLGVAIYITITMLPLYYQEVLGYTAFSAGLVVGPRGIGSILGMPIIGWISNKVDNRLLLTFGFTGFAICSIIFGRVDLDISPTTLLIPIVITGFVLSFVFVPISSLATSTIRNEDMGNATGIFNLLRNVGGSIGIAGAQTMLIRRTDFHRSNLVAAVPRAGAVYQSVTQEYTSFLARHLGKAAGGMAAQGELYRQLNQQALLWSFVDIFRWTALLGFLAAILSWLFQNVKHRSGATAMH
ncbi:MAG TPA: DHA2 family efflux MFS transporter permease subunit [Acidisarcina sp.]|nr:DHA2 family efflux MFS transporter permease subunit [Acidisarcina sp.]